MERSSIQYIKLFLGDSAVCIPMEEFNACFEVFGECCVSDVRIVFRDFSIDGFYPDFLDKVLVLAKEK